MVSKITMKHLNYLLLIMLSVVLFSCKEDNWLDWKAQNEMWLQQNAGSDAAIITTADSLQYKIIYGGLSSDARPQSTSTITCDYKLRLINGYQVDASTDAVLAMSSVVKGFSEGMSKIHNHGDIILYIPWQLGYGSEGHGTEGTQSYIPPYSTLIYEVHLSSVMN